MTVQEVIERVKKQESIVNSLEQDEKCIILMALEKQIPQKRIKGKMYESVGYYQCPACGGLLTTNKRFCEDCGQAIDWSE